MLLPHGAVIVMVDGEKLDLLRNRGDEAEPALSAAPTPKLDAHNKGAGARHVSSAANHDERQLREDAHAAAVTDWLNAEAASGAIEHLVIIASPRSLGEMRRRYSKALQAALIGELDKDLTGRSGQEVLSALRHK
jgi:protein required for attachment to host cells